MKDINPLLYVMVIYVVVTLLGLYVGARLIDKIYVTGELPPAVSNPEEASSSAQLFLYILVMTGFLLLLIRFNLNFMIKALSYLALFGGMLVTLSSVFDYAGLPLALLMLLVSVWKKQNLLVMNSSLVVTIAGVGAFLGASLAVFPAVLLLLVLSVYDLVAVFWTKHMVTLAEKAKGRLPFMFLIPYRGRNLGLGTGDLAIPLVFTVSVFKDYSLFNAAVTSLGGLVGLLALFLYIQTRRKVTLPALPPLVLGLVAGFVVSLIPQLLWN